MRLPLTACLLLAVSAGRFCRADPPAPPAPAPKPSAPATAGRSIAVRTASAGVLEGAIAQGNFFRWTRSRRPDLAVALGPEAQGEVEILADLLPAAAATRERLRGLPVEVGEEMALGGRTYRAPGDALAALLPAAPKPTWVVVGRSAEAVAGLVDELLFRLASPRRRRGPDYDYCVRETAWLARTGKWRAAGAGRWEIDPGADRDDIAARDRAFAGLRPVPAPEGSAGAGGWVQLLAPAGESGRPELARLAAELASAAAGMAARVPVALLPQAPITAVVESDFVAQAKDAGEIGAAVPGGRTDLALVYHPDDLFADRYALARVLLERARAVASAPPWLARGAALWLSGDWYGRPWRDWLPRLAAARALPTAEELLATAEEADASAPLWTPVAAAVVDRLPGRTIVEKLVRPPAPAAVAGILAELVRLPPPPALPRRASPLPRFQKGVSLSMLNSLEGGYHAPALDARLADLARLGADAVSLMPFAFQEAPDRPRLAYLNRHPESETDAGLIHAVRQAHAHGFTVLYKPHIWVGGDSWPGDIAMRTEADWAIWWAGYRRYILHHALLAGWAGADLLSVGCELAKTTGRLADWRDLIAAIRQVYPGRLTYAANWGSDVEQVGFWDRLDVAGVDAYYPLAEDPKADPAKLAAGARAVAERLEAAAKRAGKPLLLTEVGFAARAGAWTAPSEEGGTYSEEDQAAAYSALFAALDHRPWLAGTFVWKAFSGGEERRREEPDFRFLGRRAEGVVRAYYGK
jgi:glycosyl hydrolase family 113